MHEITHYFPESDQSEATRANCIGYEHRNRYFNRVERTSYFRGEMVSDAAEMEQFLYEEYVNEHISEEQLDQLTQYIENNPRCFIEKYSTDREKVVEGFSLVLYDTNVIEPQVRTYEDMHLIHNDKKNNGPMIVFSTMAVSGEERSIWHFLIKSRMASLGVPCLYAQVSQEDAYEYVKHGYEYLATFVENGTELHHFRKSMEYKTAEQKRDVLLNALESHFTFTEYEADWHGDLKEAEEEGISDFNKAIQYRKREKSILNILDWHIRSGESVSDNLLIDVRSWFRYQLSHATNIGEVEIPWVVSMLSNLEVAGRDEEKQKLFQTIWSLIPEKTRFFEYDLSSRRDVSDAISEYNEGLDLVFLFLGELKKIDPHYLSIKNDPILRKIKQNAEHSRKHQRHIIELFLVLGDTSLAEEYLENDQLNIFIDPPAISEDKRFSAQEIFSKTGVHTVFLNKCRYAVAMGEIEKYRQYFVSLESAFTSEEGIHYLLTHDGHVALFTFLQLLHESEDVLHPQISFDAFLEKIAQQSCTVLNSLDSGSKQEKAWLKFAQAAATVSQTCVKTYIEVLIANVKFKKDQNTEVHVDLFLSELYRSVGLDEEAKKYLLLVTGADYVSDRNDELKKLITKALTQGDLNTFLLAQHIVGSYGSDQEELLERCKFEAYPHWYAAVSDELENEKYRDIQQATLSREELALFGHFNPVKASEYCLLRLEGGVDVESAEWTELFCQLAYFSKGISPAFTKYWFSQNFIPRSASYETIFRVINQLATIHGHEDYMLVADDPSMQELLSNVFEARIVTSLEKVTAINRDSLAGIELIIQKRSGLPRELASVTKLLRTVVNQYPFAVVPGAIVLISNSTQIARRTEPGYSQHFKEIDWSDKAEQETLQKYLQDLGVFSPSIYTMYRLLWLVGTRGSMSVSALQKRAQSHHKKNRQKLESKAARYLADENHLEYEEVKAKIDRITARIEAVFNGRYEQLRSFVSTIRELRQSLHSNVSLMDLLHTIQDVFGVDNLEHDDDLAKSIFTELICLMYQPVGMSSDEVEVMIESLLYDEEELLDHISDAGLVWIPRSDGQTTEVSAGTHLQWNNEKQCYTSSLLKEKFSYHIKTDQIDAFSAHLTSLGTFFSSFSDDFSRALRSKGKVLTNIQEICNLADGVSENDVPRIHGMLMQVQEIFGIWMTDAMDELCEAADMSKQDIEKIQEQMFVHVQEILRCIELKKEQQTDTERTVDIYLSKNIASFFAKAAVGLCTSNDLDLYRRPDHFHINFCDATTQEIIANLQVYIVTADDIPEEERVEGVQSYVVIRGLNPGEKYVSTETSLSWMKLFFSVATQLAGQSGFGGPYVVGSTGWHPHTNRPEMNARLQDFYAQQKKIVLPKPFFIAGSESVSELYAISAK